MNLFAQSLKWNYPVLPGSPEWSTFNYQEKVKSCEIPSDILSSLSTSELFDVCMNFPLLHDAFFFNTLDEGVSKLLERFNGLNELINRADCSVYLLNSLSNNKNVLDLFSVLKTEEIGKEINNQMIIESLLGNKKVISGINENQKNMIAKAAYSNFVLKRSQPEAFGMFAISNAALLLCKYLNELSEMVSQSESLTEFMKTKRLDYDGKIIDELIIISSIVLK